MILFLGNFAKCPYGSYHDRSIYSMWHHFIDICSPEEAPSCSTSTSSSSSSHPTSTQSGKTSTSSSTPGNPNSSLLGAFTLSLTSLISTLSLTSLIRKKFLISPTKSLTAFTSTYQDEKLKLFYAKTVIIQLSLYV